MSDAAAFRSPVAVELEGVADLRSSLGIDKLA
jgi:hypothetical protein